MAIDRNITVFVSPKVIAELRDVTGRPKVIRKLRLVAERVEEFFLAIEITATLLDGIPEIFSYERDPVDAHYVNLALAANAKLIVSRDKDLLHLMDVGRPEGVEFQRKFPNLRILEPVAFLREIDVAEGS